MAALTQQPIDISEGEGYVKVAQWTLTSADPKGDPIELPEYNDITWTVLSTGTTLGGAVVSVRTGPNTTDADFCQCKNAAGGAAIALNAVATCATSIERSRYIAPYLSTVGAGATVVVHATMRRSNPKRT